MIFCNHLRPRNSRFPINKFSLPRRFVLVSEKDGSMLWCELGFLGCYDLFVTSLQDDSTRCMRDASWSSDVFFVAAFIRPRNPRFPIYLSHLQYELRARMSIFKSGISGSGIYAPPGHCWCTAPRTVGDWNSKSAWVFEARPSLSWLWRCRHARSSSCSGLRDNWLHFDKSERRIIARCFEMVMLWIVNVLSGLKQGRSKRAPVAWKWAGQHATTKCASS